MDISSIWNQLLLNASTICLRPSPSVIEGIRVITPYVISSDTNSSLGSEASVPFQENENEGDDDNEEETEESEIANDGKESGGEKDGETIQKKAIQRVRYSKEEYRCMQCPYTCTTEKAFLRHLRWCDSKESESKKHLLSCPICGKDRRNEDTLSLHMSKHKQDKYFCCDICKFKSLQLKKKKCCGCDESLRSEFSKSSASNVGNVKLIQHRRMHTGEKPHLCPFCSYRSSRRDNLRSHVRRVHKKEDLPCDTFTPRSMILSPRKVN